MAPIEGLLSSAGDVAERYALKPTRTFVTDALFRRQTTSGATTTITVIQTQPATNSGGGGGGGSNGNAQQGVGNQTQTLSGGAIAGIVIGSIVGILLLVWIFRSCSNMGAPPVKGDNPSGAAWYDGVRDEPYPPSRHHRSRSRSGHSRHRSHSRRPSVREYTTAVPVVQPQPTYVYEQDVRRSRRGRSRDHRSRSASRYD